MNKIILIGNLTKDPDLRYTTNGAAVLRFTLAVDKNLSKEKRLELEAEGKPTAEFIGVTAWAKTAELLAQYTKKGQKVAIEGRVEANQYEKDGERIYTQTIVAERIQFI